MQLKILQQESLHINYKELLEKIVANLKSHRSSELRNDSNHDRILQGSLRVVERILTMIPELK